MMFDWQSWIGMDALSFVYCIVIILGAAFIRGYSGFGFSALTVSGLSLVLAPAEVVPIAFLLEIAASIHMLPLVWKSIDWKSLKWLLSGALLGTPVGILFLTEIPAAQMHLGISFMVLIASFLLLKNYRWTQSPSGKWVLAVGTFSGWVNGAAAIGGLPVVLFFLSTSAGASLSRASLVAYSFFTDLYAVLLSGEQDLLSTQLMARAAVFLLPLTIGIFLGHRRFTSSSPETFRHFAIILLLLLSSAGILKSMMELF